MQMCASPGPAAFQIILESFQKKKVEEKQWVGGGVSLNKKKKALVGHQHLSLLGCSSKKGYHKGKRRYLHP